MLNTWQRVNPRRRSASEAGLAAINAGRFVASRIADVGQPSMRSVMGSAAAAAAAAAGIGYSRRNKKSRAMVVSGSVPFRQIVKGKRRKGKGIRVSRYQRKKIRKVCQSVVKGPKKLTEWVKNEMAQYGSAENKVAWHTVDLGSQTAWLNYLQNETIATTSDGASVVYTQNPATTSVLTTALQNKRYKIVRLEKMTFKNNTNGAVEMVFYKVKCLQATNNSPTANLDARIAAGYVTNSTTATDPNSAPLAKEDNFHQYFSTYGSSKLGYEWKAVSCKKILLAPGDEYVYYETLVIPMNLRNPSSTTYQKGSQGILLRQMGRPTHGAGAVGNLGIGKTLVDCLRYEHTIVYQYSSAVNTESIKQIANGSFSTLTGGGVNASEDIIGPYDES